jgi:hypothetical protein
VGVCAIYKHFSGFEFFLLPSRIHARMQVVDLALIMHKLNHESIAYTKRYLGITDDELQAVAQRLKL